VPTTLEKPTTTKADLKALRVQAERQLREVAQKMKEMQAVLDQLKAVAGVPPSSPLDNVQELLEATSDLRVENGNLSADKVARAFGIRVSDLAERLGRSRQALAKTPDADSVQDDLISFERVARLRALVGKPEDFLKWLRMPNAQLDNQKPLDLMAGERCQIVVNLVEDMLTGAPT
jgi:hypothetical protein